jgi:hypothetical protein
MKLGLSVKFSVFFFTVLIMGCYATAKEEPTQPQPSHIASLQWVKTADVKHDINQALDIKDYRLLVLVGRGGNALGINAKDADRLKQLCGTKFLPGSTDFVIDQQQLNLLDYAYAYAKTYNQSIVAHCSK